MGVWKRRPVVDTLGHEHIGPTVVFQTLEIYIYIYIYRPSVRPVVSVPSSRRRPMSVRPIRPSRPPRPPRPSVDVKAERGRRRFIKPLRRQKPIVQALFGKKCNIRKRENIIYIGCESKLLSPSVCQVGAMKQEVAGKNA